MRIMHLNPVQQVLLHIYFVKSVELAATSVSNSIEKNVALASKQLKFIANPIAGKEPHCTNNFFLNISLVDCKNIEDNRMIHADADVKISTVVVYRIKDSSMRNITKGSFQKLNIESITLRNSKVEYFDLFGGFHGLEDSLVNIKLVNVAIVNWKFSSGEHFRKIETTILEMPSGAPQWTVDPIIPCLPTNIKNIYLKNFIVRSLEIFTFERFDGLVSLSLIRNGLTFVSRTFLARPARNISTYELSYNPITSLPDDMFIDMPNLTKVSLEGTELTTLSYQIFKPVFGTLNELQITGIPLTCDCEATWLYIKKHVWTISNVKCNLPSSLKDRTFNAVFPIDICMNCGESNTT